MVALAGLLRIDLFVLIKTKQGNHLLFKQSHSELSQGAGMILPNCEKHIENFHGKDMLKI